MFWAKFKPLVRRLIPGYKSPGTLDSSPEFEGEVVEALFPQHEDHHAASAPGVVIVLIDNC